jgi:hypothetical protein
MTTYAWPFKPGFVPEQMNWGAENRTLSTESILSGAIQTTGVPGKRWKVGMNIPATSYKDRLVRMALEGFLDRLGGKEHRVTLWHMGRKGVGGYGYPMGTINQTGVTVNVDASQFASSLTLAGCGANTLLMPGDLFSVGDQLIMNPAVAQASAGGIMVLPVITRLRAALSAGAPVLLVRPTATFVLDSNSWTSGYSVGANQGLGLDFTEVFR